jgi:hypothetical protein
LENPHELREMAEWYRGMAEVGHTDSRESRLFFAEHLERRANDIEAARNADPGSSA